MSHNPPWKSETKTFNAGSTADFYDFVPLVGPSGGRVVIDKLIACVTGTLAVAAALYDGRDVPRLLQLATVEKRDGRLRWNLSGQKSRIASIRYNGIDEYMEHANVAVGAGAAIDLRIILPMRKRFLRRGRDFALPADAFKRVTLAFNTPAGAATGTTVLSAFALSAFILAEWHEENSVEFKCDDLVKSTDFNSNTQCKLALSGVVHDLDIVKEDTTAGGAVVTAITDARIEDLGTPTLTFADLKTIYTIRRQVAPTGFAATPNNERFLDPIREGKCLPVIVSDFQTSPWDGRLLDSLKVDVGTGAAGLSVISREVVDKSQADYQATVARFGVKPESLHAVGAADEKQPIDQRDKRKALVQTWSAPMRKAA